MLAEPGASSGFGMPQTGVHGGAERVAPGFLRGFRSRVAFPSLEKPDA